MIVASVSHQGVAPPQPGTPAASLLSSAHAQARQPAGELAAVQTGGSVALVVMQSLTWLLHICWTVQVVPLGLIVPRTCSQMSPISPHVPSCQAPGRDVGLAARPTSGSVTLSTSSCEARTVKF